MIKEIRRIIGVGRLECSSSVEFKKNTIIYGENGRGKSTLSSIFRSLQSGNPDSICERLTLGLTDENSCEVKICVNPFGNVQSGEYSFKNRAWNKTISQIAVFDVKFVADNVHTTQVTGEHQRNLLTFVLGEENVSLQMRISDLDTEIDQINTEIRDIKSDLLLCVLHSLDLESFQKLPLLADAETTISAQKVALDQCKQSDTISKTPNFHKIILPVFDIEKLLLIWEKSLETIENNAEALVLNHQKRLPKSSLSWIESGQTFIQDEFCPFCGQDINRNSLIASYRGYFGEAYKTHRDEIGETEKTYLNLFSPTKAQQISGVISENRAVCAFWSQHHVSLNLPDIEYRLTNIFDGIRLEIQSGFEKKKKDILSQVFPDDRFFEIVSEYEQIRSEVDALNLKISDRINQIDTIKNGIKLDLRAEIGKLHHMENQLQRQTEEVINKFAILEALQQAKEAKSKQKTDCQRVLANQSEELFSTYQKALNTHLKLCGCAFQIVNSKISNAGGISKIVYGLSISNKKVDLNGTKGDPRCFKNTLSEGDKSALAFAFFATRLLLENDSKMVIIDDPMTSQDEHRRTYTANLIKAIHEKSRQTILLTHDISFGQLMCKILGKDTLVLEVLDNNSGKSNLAQCNLNTKVTDLFISHFNCINAYLKGDTLDSDLKVAQSLRPLLEGNLKHRFPEQLGTEGMLGTILDELGKKSLTPALEKLKCHKIQLESFRSFTNPFHHDNPPTTINSKELRTYADWVIEFIAGV